MHGRHDVTIYQQGAESLALISIQRAPGPTMHADCGGVWFRGTRHQSVELIYLAVADVHGPHTAFFAVDAVDVAIPGLHSPDVKPTLATNGLLLLHVPPNTVLVRVPVEPKHTFVDPAIAVGTA